MDSLVWRAMGEAGVGLLFAAVGVAVVLARGPLARFNVARSPSRGSRGDERRVRLLRAAPLLMGLQLALLGLLILFGVVDAR